MSLRERVSALWRSWTGRGRRGSPRELDLSYLDAKEALLEQAWRWRQGALETEFRELRERQAERERELVAWETRLIEREQQLRRVRIPQPS